MRVFDRKPFIEIAQRGQALRQDRADQAGDVFVLDELYVFAGVSEVEFDPAPASEKPV